MSARASYVRNGGGGSDLQVRGQDADLYRDVDDRAGGGGTVPRWRWSSACPRSRAPRLPHCRRPRRRRRRPRPGSAEHAGLQAPDRRRPEARPAHNQAEIDIASQGALRPATARREGARAHFEQVRRRLRKLNARRQDAAAARRRHAKSPRRGRAGLHPLRQQPLSPRSPRSLTNANSAVDVGSQLHMIGTYGRGEQNVLVQNTPR